MINMNNNLEAKLWAVADELRGNMDASEFKNYMLGLIFYRYLSERIESHLNKELENDGITFAQAYEKEDYKEDLEEEATESLGYFVEPSHLYSTIVTKCTKREFILDDLAEALNTISNSSLGHESQDDFSNLFEDVDLTSSKLGKNPEKRNRSHGTAQSLSGWQCGLL